MSDSDEPNSTVTYYQEITRNVVLQDETDLVSRDIELSDKDILKVMKKCETEDTLKDWHKKSRDKLRSKDKDLYNLAPLSEIYNQIIRELRLASKDLTRLKVFTKKEKTLPSGIKTNLQLANRALNHIANSWDALLQVTTIPALNTKSKRVQNDARKYVAKVLKMTVVAGKLVCPTLDEWRTWKKILKEYPTLEYLSWETTFADSQLGNPSLTNIIANRVPESLVASSRDEDQFQPTPVLIENPNKDGTTLVHSTQYRPQGQGAVSVARYPMSNTGSQLSGMSLPMRRTQPVQTTGEASSSVAYGDYDDDGDDYDEYDQYASEDAEYDEDG